MTTFRNLMWALVPLALICFIVESSMLLHKVVEQENARMMVLHTGFDTVANRLTTTLGHVEAAATDADRVVLSLGGTATLVRQSAKREQAYYDNASRDIAVLLHHLDADRGTVVAQVNTTLTTANTALHEVGVHTHAAGENLDQAIAHIQQAADTLNGAVSETATTLNGKDVQDTLTQAASAAQHLNNSMESVDAALRPLRITKGRIKSVFGWLFRIF